MRRILLILGLLTPTVLLGQVTKIPPRKPVPPEILRSAQMAVQGLADRVVRGDFQAVVDKMYPTFKKKEAAKAGGMKRFEAKTLRGLKKLQGDVRLSTMQALQPYSGFEANFGVADRVINGQKVSSGFYREWVVFVPTQSIIFATDSAVDPPQIHKLRSDSFQIAISRKGSGVWTFMDGAQVKAFQLRQFFPYLPADDKQLGLPKVGGEILGLAPRKKR